MKNILTLPKIFVIFSVLWKISEQMNIGTVLFMSGDIRRKCWSPSSTRLLVTRMIIEDLLPCPSILSMIDDEVVSNLVEYVKLVYHIINKETCGNKRHILVLAFSDALGGYMRHVVLPNVKYSFYAGTLDYNSVEKMLNLYKETKAMLKTNGQGWADPICDSYCRCEPHSFSVTCPKDCKPCEALTLYYGPRFENCDSNVLSPFPDVAVPIPYFDRLYKPTTLAVPLKSYPLRGVQAPWGLNLVVKYYLTGYKCMAKRRNARAMKMFQNGVYSWIMEEVVPLMKDEEIYTVFGGVLRVLATMKRLGARRINLHALRRLHSQMTDAYIRRTSIWSFTKHRKLAVAILIFLFIWFVIGFFFICCKLRECDSRSTRSRTEGSKKSCKCEGTFKGAVRSVTCTVRKTISSMKGGSRTRSDSRTTSPTSKKDCMCFAVKDQVYNKLGQHDEGRTYDGSSMKKTTLDGGSDSLRKSAARGTSYSVGFDLQTSSSGSGSDSDTDMVTRSQTPRTSSK